MPTQPTPNSPTDRPKAPKLALHWKILIGLVLGIVVGVGINLGWTEDTWERLGVEDPKRFLKGTPPEITDVPDQLIVEPSWEDFRLGLNLLRGELNTRNNIEFEAAVNAAAWIVYPFIAEDGLVAVREVPLSPEEWERRVAVRDAELDRIATLANGDPPEKGRVTPGILSPHLWTLFLSDQIEVSQALRSRLEALYQNEQTIRETIASNNFQMTANADAGALAHAARFTRSATEFIGDLFMRGLRFIAVPIVLFSLIVGVASLKDIAKLGRIGGTTVGIYLCTTAVAITIGLLFANIARPGANFPDELRQQLAGDQAQAAADKIGNAEKRPSTRDVALDIVPGNPFTALAETEMLQVVFAAIVVGIGLTLIKPEKSRPVVAFFDAMTDVVIMIVHGVLAIAPYAVFALIVTVVADLGIPVLLSLLRYVLTTIAGLAVMMFVVYPLLLAVFTKVKYGRFFWAISPAQLLAFSSSSSGATLPVTMECCEERLGCKEEVTSFVVPVGATVNMDGTALYQGVAAVFIAQMYGIDLSVAQQLQIVLTATLASIGTAAVPGVGIVMLVIVLQSVGLPLEGIAVILGVDRILDMCRTACNVTGDCAVCAVVASREGALGDPRALTEPETQPEPQPEPDTDDKT